MATAQDILDLARLDINDASTDSSARRYSDADGLKYLNHGLARTLTLRPDLRMGTATGTGIPSGAYGYSAFTPLVATSSFPLPIDFEDKLKRIVIFGWQMRDDEYVSNNKAKLSYELFIKEVLNG